ncbi:MAG TPA: cyanophycin synthetase [Clostridia bacterium]|nr:cyanophycin synthetase [Clostridia bacterium]
MDICDLTIFEGRNIYSHRPVMKMVVDIGEYADTPTKDIRGFNEKLLQSFPGLKTNCCGLGYEGGFLEKLRSGTYLAHVLEHVVLEMQFMLGYDVRYGKTRLLEEPSYYYLVYEYENEICGLECGKAATFILNCFLNGEDIEIGEFLDYLKSVSAGADLGPSTSAIVKEAKKRGLPITRIGHDSLVRLGYGKHSRLVESTLTDATPCIAADISSNKQLTKSILSEHQIPVPYGKVVYSELSAVMAAGQVGPPVVIKPFDANQGKGVRLNLKTEEEIRIAFQEASKYSSGVIVEKYIQGKDYRILVVGGKVRAVAERLAASVTGDGTHTIGELVEMVNLDPNRGESHEKPLTKIHLNQAERMVLKKKGLTLDSIPGRGDEITLRENANLSTGGIAIDRTDVIHPDNADIAVRAANAIGLDIAGIDVVAGDISHSIVKTGGAVVEVNTAPGIRMHLYPSQGTPRNVASDIVDMLFPTAESKTFPIVSVTGTNGKTTTVRLIAHTLSLSGKTVGMTSTSGTFINGKCICKGDNSGPLSAKCLLSNKQIDAAVLETARGGIVRQGLGYDLADVGIITNITDDHLGLDGINTLEDLAYVKALVAEAVKPGGSAVLNAADPMTLKILGRVKADKILFCLNLPEKELFSLKNTLFVYFDSGWITIKSGERLIRVAQIKDIPITSGGIVTCNIENCLAAVSALYALKIPVSTIAEGLKTFENNTGRFDLFNLGNYQVLIDYAHNKAGFEVVFDACSKLKYKRLVGVIGMPGDRNNSSLREVGKLCAQHYDRIYIKEDLDLRGRQPGEVAGVFNDAILSAGYPKDRVSIILKETDALEQAMKTAQSGDLIVVHYEKLQPLVDLVGRAKNNQEKTGALAI